MVRVQRRVDLRDHLALQRAASQDARNHAGKYARRAKPNRFVPPLVSAHAITEAVADSNVIDLRPILIAEGVHPAHVMPCVVLAVLPKHVPSAIEAVEIGHIESSYVSPSHSTPTRRAGVRTNSNQ